MCPLAFDLARDAIAQEESLPGDKVRIVVFLNHSPTRARREPGHACLQPKEVGMAYREVGMVEVREIVRRWLAGDGLRSIARALGVDRKTVAEYVRLAHAAGIARWMAAHSSTA